MLKAHFLDVGHGDRTVIEHLSGHISVIGPLARLAMSPAQAPVDWRIAVGLIIGAGRALYRMHCFARHWGREVFVQFLQLPEREKSKEDPQ